MLISHDINRELGTLEMDNRHQSKTSGEIYADFSMSRISKDIRESLSPEQYQTIRGALIANTPFSRHALDLRNRSLPPSFQVRSEGRKEGEPSENVHSRDAMTEPTWMYSRRFSEGSPLFLPGV